MLSGQPAEYCWDRKWDVFIKWWNVFHLCLVNCFWSQFSETHNTTTWNNGDLIVTSAQSFIRKSLRGIVNDRTSIQAGLNKNTIHSLQWPKGLAAGKAWPRDSDGTCCRSYSSAYLSYVDFGFWLCLSPASQKFNLEEEEFASSWLIEKNPEVSVLGIQVDPWGWNRTVYHVPGYVSGLPCWLTG